MREELDRLLEDITLLTIAFAIALGWSLFQLAHGVATFLDGLTIHLPDPNGDSGFSGPVNSGGGLSWIVGRHVISLDGMVVGLIELALVLAVATFVRSRIDD
jgi:hypothetical protein